VHHPFVLTKVSPQCIKKELTPTRELADCLSVCAGAVKETVVQFVVNGKQVITDPEESMTLLDFLRDKLSLMGTKNGCGTGHCGACTVVIDGKARRSCQVRLKNMERKKVETIEGLASNGQLHPIQSAFVKAGAIQCGFCTPGIIMATKALLDQNLDPDIEDIQRALEHNLCRCTGYVKIVDAIRLAARDMQASAAPAPEKPLEPQARIGQSIPDYDSLAKVRGEPIFAADLVKEKMLFGKVLWSAFPHARIKKIDGKRAKELPGVQAVLTADDIPGSKCFGRVKADNPILCSDRVRFLGDAVALVVAESQDAARDACNLIDVHYEELPGVFSIAESLRDGATLLHADGNICKEISHEIGNVDEARKKCRHIVSGHFETVAVDPGYLEPDAGVAFFEDDILTIYFPTQGPFHARQQVAESLNLPVEKVRVVVTPLGGGHGGRTDSGFACLLGLAAFKTGMPVKIVLDREETLRVGTKKHPFQMDYEIGADADGNLLFVKAKLLADAGPYTSLTVRVLDQAVIFATGPYEVPNARIDALAAFTNNANTSAMRGFGINQVAVPVESLLDELSRKMGIDPFELRRRNVLAVGKKTLAGQILTSSVGIQATIDKAEASLVRETDQFRALYTHDPSKRLGIGIASAFKNVGAGKGRAEDAGAIFTLERDGTVLARVSGIDMGQGFRTVILQIAVEVTGLAPQVLRLITGDTLLTPKHNCAIGERQTLICGKAALMAGNEFKTNLLAKAAALSGFSPESLDVLEDRIIDKASGRTIVTLEELGRKLAPSETVKGECEYLAPPTYALYDVEARKRVPPEEYRNYPSYAYTTHVAFVEVDTLSGKVRVLKIIAAHDVGVAINPQKIEGQIEGSTLMGLGYALKEEFVVEKGIFRSRNYKDCGIPTIRDMPSIEVIIVEDPEPMGPYGAKGISEIATVPATPAILNAIYDAIGKRIYSIPAKPGKILELLNT
jgi:CO/xanthine dehydrogenase Mo-binding subunit/aerobic-type carbon monoxide dehydrogenase small subunit (CoxS/CutS family)